jgi:hypothetical protein
MEIMCVCVYVCVCLKPVLKVKAEESAHRLT